MENVGYNETACVSIQPSGQPRFWWLYRGSAQNETVAGTGQWLYRDGTVGEGDGDAEGSWTTVHPRALRRMKLNLETFNYALVHVSCLIISVFVCQRCSQRSASF